MMAEKSKLELIRFGFFRSTIYELKQFAVLIQYILTISIYDAFLPETFHNAATGMLLQNAETEKILLSKI